MDSKVIFSPSKWKVIVKRINQYWRVFATGLCFFIFGLGALCLSFVVFPLLSLGYRHVEARQLKVQNTIRLAFLLFCKTMRFTGAIDYEFTNVNQLKKDDKCIIIANHPSLIDYVLIASQRSQCDCLVKYSIWQNPFMKGIVRVAGYIPNDGMDKLFSLCQQRLVKDRSLLIFPEGTRTTPGVVSKLQRGAAQIAVRTKTDIRLVHISVTPSFLTKEKKWYQVPNEKPFFKIEVKEKIAINPFLQQAATSAIAARNLTHFLEQKIYPQT